MHMKTYFFFQFFEMNTHVFQKIFFCTPTMKKWLYSKTFQFQANRNRLFPHKTNRSILKNSKNLNETSCTVQPICMNVSIYLILRSIIWRSLFVSSLFFCVQRLKHLDLKYNRMKWQMTIESLRFPISETSNNTFSNESQLPVKQIELKMSACFYY